MVFAICLYLYSLYSLFLPYLYFFRRLSCSRLCVKCTPEKDVIQIADLSKVETFAQHRTDFGDECAYDISAAEALLPMMLGDAEPSPAIRAPQERKKNKDALRMGRERKKQRKLKTED